MVFFLFGIGLVWDWLFNRMVGSFFYWFGGGFELELFFVIYLFFLGGEEGRWWVYRVGYFKSWVV